jgi:hypothetical protein
MGVGVAVGFGACSAVMTLSIFGARGFIKNRPQTMTPTPLRMVR